MSQATGMRIGAAGNQAATVVAGLGLTDPAAIKDMYADLLEAFYSIMDGFEGGVDNQAFNNIVTAFPGTTVVETPQATPQVAPQQAAVAVAERPVGNLTVRGEQHGDIPSWMYTEAAAKGVVEVYDNRDQLSVNAKRPWFRSTDKEHAFWPPRKG